MKEYINTATNHKVLVQKWTGSEASTKHLNPYLISNPATDKHSYNYNEDDFKRNYLLAKPKKLLVSNNIEMNGLIKNNDQPLLPNEYVVMRAKDALCTDDIDVNLSVIKTKVFKKWYKPFIEKGKSAYAVMHTWSNNTYDENDPVKVVGVSYNLASAYEYKCKCQWNGDFDVYLEKVHRA